MATLTEAAYYTRKAFKYGAVGVAIIIVLRIAFAVFVTFWKATHPPPPPEATVAFGKLPAIVFPPQEKPPLTFNLETATGTTGEFEPLANVYVVPEKRSSLLALERATELAESMNFLFEPGRLGDTLYQWTKDEPLPSTLEIDILTGHFSFDADWRVKPELLSGTEVLSEVDAVGAARNWLSGLQLLSNDLSAGVTKVRYLKVAGTEIVPALSPSEAQFIRVDLFRGNLEESRILPLDPNKGIVSIMLLSTSRGRTQVISAEYRYFPVDYEQSATYPIITSKSAWKQLQIADAYYAFIPETMEEIAVRKVTLDYLDPPQAEGFMQPIFVFEGDGGFVGYVLAVAAEHVQQSQ